MKLKIKPIKESNLRVSGTFLVVPKIEKELIDVAKLIGGMTTGEPTVEIHKRSPYSDNDEILVYVPYSYPLDYDTKSYLEKEAGRLFRADYDAPVWWEDRFLVIDVTDYVGDGQWILDESINEATVHDRKSTEKYFGTFNAVKDNIEKMLLEEFEDNLAKVVQSNVPEYDSTWCCEEPVDYIDSNIDKARRAYARALADCLLHNANF